MLGVIYFTLDTAACRSAPCQIVSSRTLSVTGHRSALGSFQHRNLLSIITKAQSSYVHSCTRSFLPIHPQFDSSSRFPQWLAEGRNDYIGGFLADAPSGTFLRGVGVEKPRLFAGAPLTDRVDGRSTVLEVFSLFLVRLRLGQVPHLPLTRNRNSMNNLEGEVRMFGNRSCIAEYKGGV